MGLLRPLTDGRLRTPGTSSPSRPTYFLRPTPLAPWASEVPVSTHLDNLWESNRGVGCVSPYASTSLSTRRPGQWTVHWCTGPRRW